jgi:hypothetical protein
MQRARALAMALATTALVVSPAVAAPPAATVWPTHINFGNQPFESNTKQSFTVTNRSDQTILVSIEQVQVGDDFSPGQVESTCPLTDSSPLEPGQSCTHVVGFRPSRFFAGHEVALMRVIIRDTAGNLLDTRDVTLTGRGH